MSSRDRISRNISEDFRQKILSAFPVDNTLAIIVFGSYGTCRQRKDSDIDIAWISKGFVQPTELSIKTNILEELLKLEVDLKIVKDYYPALLLKNILDGDVLYEDDEFYFYYNNFYYNNRDLLDVLLGGYYGAY